MDRGRKAMPVGNKQCYQRHVQMCQDKHKQKLREMKCSIDNAPPKRHSHLHKNLKKEQLMEERFAEIERDNRLLLEKMSYIMRHNSLDNVNTSTQYGHSLNKEQRKRELQRITKDNQAILRRIQHSEPTYDHLSWLEEARRNEQYMKNICELKVTQGRGMQMDPMEKGYGMQGY
mmetsp:Transcript_11971/g.21212  ORF Transcript_11971/g.21212 Transcript_11971/m.21212 type:complete len:174 (+) Transcript_11971:117-638(+)|eukprot:CAMPEP_0205920750 /NCGR_PEP_ID=MMETSP1325-20131115/11676_1 /ASSEMBLY_ACC=CAM_ASM_000708 /TAXON_ID=236786 /ORGANISM="Florenciella sp., Strain RCC1007" /LENGTH=173 /DNA_ID=CAMNT_0053288473 /DNA_START=117 /DNA_END=638 /DNA_ORIENTATION=+